MILRIIHFVWRVKWAVVRTVFASSLLWCWFADTPARLVRTQFASMPGMDYLAEAKKLRSAGRCADALVVLDAAGSGSSEEEQEAIEAARAKIVNERDSLVRKAMEAARGVLFGTGDSVEAMLGAIGADLFVVGDIRDLIIEGTKLGLDGDADELILAFSAVGLLSSVQPELDWIPAFLKLIRKAGGFSRKMVEELLRMCRRVRTVNDAGEFLHFAKNVKAVVDGSSVATAVRVLRHIDDPKELENVARFVQRYPDGGFALVITGKEGVTLLKRSAHQSENFVRLAARKGNRGVAWLRTRNVKLLRPHPIIGLLKGWKKGHLQAVTQRVLDWLDPRGWIVLPALAAWVFVEVILLSRRLAFSFCRCNPPSSKA